ncbi:CUZD1 [Branchiostoma lanceolatum]|uniref:CUZD1 protein n=1 Tax=Branchiostoma lanceolatum TaxID=7740 RepID=A0A8J9ZB42_BRALA|nr:CUZD1 [Branchiostoma lanceolatum]
MIMKSPLNACGTTSYETPDYIIYDNVVTDESLARAGEIIRDCGFEMRIQCQIPRRLQVSGDFDPIQVPEMYAAVGTGDINVIMHFCTDSVCSNFKPYPVTYRVCEQVYVEVQLLSSDPDLSILVLTGEATPSMSRTGSPLYDIINQGCGVDPTYVVYPAPNHAVIRFGFQAFKFATDYPKVYLHADVLICKSSSVGNRCSQGCATAGRRRRDLATTPGVALYHVTAPAPMILFDDVDETLVPQS